MGRLARQTKPPPSGAIIFYGRCTSLPVVDISNQDPSTAPDAAIRGTFGGSQSTLGSQPSSDARSLQQVLEKSESNLSLTAERGSGSRLTVLKLALTILETFEDVPYVKVVAGLVKKIVAIYDEIQSNKARAKELINKVFVYGRVVFEALLALDKEQVKDLSGIKEDLEQIAIVLQSIYDVVQNFADSKSKSRLKRLLYRDDVAGQLEEQDRRLETAITAFQLKSLIVVRSSGSGERDRSYIKESLHPSTTPRKVLTRRSKPQIVYGRKEEINLLAECLLETRPETEMWWRGLDDEPPYPSRICILGSGGIGKTTLALSVLHHESIVKKFEEERFFVPCEAASTPGLFLDQLATSLGINVEESKESILKAVIYRLKKGLSLLVLDNFETPWDPPENRSEIEAILAELTSTKRTSIVLTMRGSQKPNGIRWSQGIPPLQPVDVHSATTIFKAISHKDDEFVSKLVKAVDCVPLAVTLIATLASVDGETTESLWLRWQEENTSMMNNGDDRLNSLEASVQLSLSSPRMHRDPTALTLLRVFCLLPDGVSPVFLQACEKGLPEVPSVKKALSTLRQNALVYEDSSRDIRILSPIRLFMKARYPPSNKLHRFVDEYFIDLARRGIDYQDPVLRQQLQREANNINFILVDSLESSSDQNGTKIVNAVLCFCHYMYASGSGSTDAISRAVSKLEARKSPSTTYLPVSIPSDTARGKGIWQKAFSGAYKSKDLTTTGKEGAKGVDLSLQLRANCLGCWGQMLSRQHHFSLAREKFDAAQALHIEVGDIPGQAYDLLNIGMLLAYEGNWKDALVSFRQALELHEKLGDRTGKAYDYLAMGNASRDIAQFDEAQKMLASSAQLFEELQDKVGHASALNGLGNVLLSLTRSSEAEAYFSHAAELCNVLGDAVGEADNIAGLAVTYLLRSRFLDARKAIQRAISVRHPFVDAEHIHILGRICIATGHFEEAQVHLSRSLAHHEYLGDHRGRAADLYYLATIELHHGDRRKLKELLYKAAEVNREHVKNPLVEAEINLLFAQANLRVIQFDKANYLAVHAQKKFEAHGCTLGIAGSVYVRGIRSLRLGEYSEALESLNHALDLHTEVGNIQGQADDLNKICEVLIFLGSLDEAMTLITDAMALHIQIGDRDGQADDLYVQATILLTRGRFAEAESMIRLSLQLHESTSSKYGLGRDYALLSDITWQQCQHDGEEDAKAAYNKSSSRTYLRQAMDTFKSLKAVGEFHECRQLQRRMKGKEPEDPSKVRLPNWTYDSDEEIGA
ncbi:hypothetical protein CPC08DRAFT_817854 [Agrocybe pediades]|nr:hypothetical protein CPC08DRAFT_817854 [Agrocybe pediades]